jgi:hypothetical protein
MICKAVLDRLVSKFEKQLILIFVLLFIAFLIDKRFQFGYYIGEARALKNVLVMVLSGWLLFLFSQFFLRAKPKDGLSKS